MRVVLFSGPPHCGKDSIAAAVAAHINQTPFDGGVYVYHPARVIRDMGMLMLGVENTDANYESLKGLPQILFDRVNGEYDTLREFMIRLLEDHLRPRYGIEFLGRVTRARHQDVWDTDAILLLPSIGFQEEADYYLHSFGAANVLSVQLTRAGCSFEGDSRGYVETPNQFRIWNCKTIEHHAGMVIERMARLGWEF